MQNLFERKRPDGDAVRRVKKLVSSHFDLPASAMIAVAELRCHEPNCPPVETVITAINKDGSKTDWRIAKSISEIDDSDAKYLEI